ncbi:MAG: Trk system potassium transporter TrkA, partial [Muribaculaceae bacterium]|nr:Trk system potassium transporter TrkA [Muribaculaceae bacterium]
MKIIIAGAGEVGSHLAKLLSKEEQDITLIDSDRERLDLLDANYNLLTIRGIPTSFTTLREARVGHCDLFIAVTPYEADNVTACSMAKSLGAQRTVARIDNYEFMAPANRGFFTSIGVDALIYPEYLAAQEIMTALDRTWVRHWFELWGGELLLVGVKLRDNASIAGMQLKNLGQYSQNFHVSAIKRRHETIIPRGNDCVNAGDIVYFTTTIDHVDQLRELCGKQETRVKRILIMGGSRIAIRLAAMAEDRYRIKIIEANRERCEHLAERCPNCEIICGDARDTDLMREEGLDQMDAFIALTGSAETNILACLTSKEFGASKTIAEVENIQLIAEAEGLNIGTVINKKLLASRTIFQLLLDAD